MDDPMITLIRSTLDAKASEIEIEFDAASDVAPPTPRPRRHRVLAAAACVAVIASGVGALVATRGLDSDPAAVGSVPPSPTTEDPVGASDPSAAEIQWFLPAQVPEGYELAEIFAIRGSGEDGAVTYLAYDVAANGLETPRYGFYVTAKQNGDADPPEPAPDAQIVDGIEYSIMSEPEQTGDDPERITITWSRDVLQFAAGGYVPKRRHAAQRGHLTGIGVGARGI